MRHRARRLDRGYNPSYTALVKTAISIPDGLFGQVEALARRLGLSRSRLFCLAVEQFLSRHAAEEVIAALDRIYAEQQSSLDDRIEELQSLAVAADEDAW